LETPVDALPMIDVEPLGMLDHLDQLIEVTLEA